jgi:cytoskeletal protein CcmA (bactofilin family)
MINSIVGQSTKLKGDFEIDGILRIDGVFEGSVKGQTDVLIGEKGQAFFDLDANQITIGGYVEGKIRVNGKLTILSTGTLKGSVQAKNIIVEPGALLFANCKMIS